MPDQDNVSLEKVSLTSNDFSEDLGDNAFGIQDTQVLASNDLQNFLLSDPDDVKNVDNKSSSSQEPAKKVQSQSNEENKENSKKEKEESKPDGKESLENILFKDPNDDNDDETKRAGTPNEDPKEAQQSADDDTYHTLAKDFLRLGVFTKNSDDETEENINVKTPEEFLERFSLEKKKGAISILDNFLSQFGEDRRRVFDAIFVNGVEPNEYLSTFAKIESIKNVDINDERNQEKIVRTYYRGLNWDDNKIDTRIQKLKDYGDLEDEAKSYQEVLLNKENEREAELIRKKEADIQAAKEKELSLKNSYQRILVEKLKAQEMDGIPLTEKEAVETLKYLVEKKYKLESGEFLSEFDKDLLELNRPENHELKVKLGLLLKKKLDLSSIKKATISKKSDQLFTLSTKNAKHNQKEKEIKSFF